MSGKLDALFQQARRSSGTDRAKKVNADDRKRSGGDAAPVATGDDTERLTLIEGRDGRMRYLLAGDEVRVGDELEVYVNESNGWLYGTFQWSGRERHAPSLRVQLKIPGESALSAGDLDAVLPKHARVRRA